MIQVIFRENEDFIKVHGLTQWDYGQYLQITGLKDLKRPEVHFAVGMSSEALIVQAQFQEDGSIVARIPDKHLEKGSDITAHVYVADENSGETVRTILMCVKRRAKPEEYDAPGEKNLLRQVLEKLDAKADNIELVEGELVLRSGKTELPPRVRLPTGSGSGEIELRNNGSVIQWRYTDSNEWKDLVTLEELQGPPGETPEFEIREGHLYAIYQK